MLEKAVRWLIMLLIFVFDPLAVLMLIAANLTEIKEGLWGNKNKKVKGDQTNDRDGENDDRGDSEKADGTESTGTSDNGGDAPNGLAVAAEEEGPVAYTPEVAFVSIEEPKPAEEKEVEQFIEQAAEEVFEEIKQEEEQAESVAQEEEQAEQPAPVEPPKKKKRNKKKLEDKSNIVEETVNEGFEPIAVVSDDAVDSTELRIEKMIEDGDTTGLESIYKQIVKELGKKNRAKTTHWGPLKKN